MLSNLYIRRFVLGWKTLGHERRLRARIVNYADDFVICCSGTADEAMTMMRVMMARLKLTVNETKTELRCVPGETFDFLGYTFGRCYSPKTGRPYLGTKPSAKKVMRLCRSISEMTGRGTTWQPTERMVAQLNRKLEGWANYFCLGSASRAYAAVDRHTSRRLRHWLRIKHKVRERGWSRFPEAFLTETLGLVSLRRRRRSFP